MSFIISDVCVLFLVSYISLSAWLLFSVGLPIRVCAYMSFCQSAYVCLLVSLPVFVSVCPRLSFPQVMILVTFLKCDDLYAWGEEGSRFTNESFQFLHSVWEVCPYVPLLNRLCLFIRPRL